MSSIVNIDNVKQSIINTQIPKFKTLLADVSQEVWNANYEALSKIEPFLMDNYAYVSDQCLKGLYKNLSSSTKSMIEETLYEYNNLTITKKTDDVINSVLNYNKQIKEVLETNPDFNYKLISDNNIQKLATNNANVQSVEQFEKTRLTTNYYESNATYSTYIPNELATGTYEELANTTKRIKTWTTLMIRSRDLHIKEDNTSITIDSAFTIGDDKLMHPADSSLGASIGNIINCRCSLIYSEK